MNDCLTCFLLGSAFALSLSLIFEIRILKKQIKELEKMLEEEEQ